MYIPLHFAERDPTELRAFIENHSFGLLISQLEGEQFATHLPFLLDRDDGPHGALTGHMARANPQWRQLAGQIALAVFSGPNSYISPRWYEAENVVPTWNYVAVHAYGRIQLIEDGDSLLEVVQRSVMVYEAAMPRPWQLDTSGPFVDRMLAQIVGFHIAVEKIEGKWKLNQSHPADRRTKVVRALRERGDENSYAIADLMAAKLPPIE